MPFNQLLDDEISQRKMFFPRGIGAISGNMKRRRVAD